MKVSPPALAGLLLAFVLFPQGNPRANGSLVQLKLLP